MDADEEKLRKELTTQEAKMLMDQIAEVSSPVFVLSGGEPLLREDIFELASYGVQKGLKVTMGTNGTLIDDENAKKLFEVGIRNVAVSIDSSTSYIHDELRGVKGAWRKALSGIESCIRNGVKVQFNVTVTRQNYYDLDNIFSLAESLNVMNCHLFFLVPTGRGKNIQDISPLMYEDLLVKILRRGANSSLEVKPTCAPQFMRIAKQLNIETTRWSRGCIAGISYCRIQPDGFVTPCPYLPIRVGNIRQTSFKNIWFNSEVFKSLRNFGNLKGKCGICIYKNICGGCRARAYGLSSKNFDSCGNLESFGSYEGDIMAEDPWCVYQPEDN